MSKPGNQAGAVQAALRLIKAHGYSIVSADSMLEREKWIESKSVEVVGCVKVRIKRVYIHLSLEGDVHMSNGSAYHNRIHCHYQKIQSKNQKASITSSKVCRIIFGCEYGADTNANSLPFKDDQSCFCAFGNKERNKTNDRHQSKN
jgi:hypothetical protein